MVRGLTGAAADLQETFPGIHPAILSHGELGPALKIAQLGAALSLSMCTSTSKAVARIRRSGSR